MKKVLYFLPTLRFGGAERKALNLVSAFASERYQLYLCVFRPQGEFRKEAEKLKILNYRLPSQLRILGFPLLKGDFTSNLLIGQYNIRHALRALEPEVVLTSTLDATIPMWFCSGERLRTKSKWIISEESNHSEGAALLFKNRWAVSVYDQVIGGIYRRADHIIAVSQGLKNKIAKAYRLPDSRLSVIHNQFDLGALETLSRARPPFEPGAEFIFAMGRLVKVKNFPLLLEAFARLTEEFPALNLIIAGDGPEKGRLEKLAARLRLEKKIRITGYLENPWSLMRRAKLTVVTSKAEGLCNVIIEAMAVECPVVATACNYGPPELIRDGVTGKLTPPGEPAALAATIRTLLKDEALRMAIAGNAKKFSQNFASPLIARQYEDVFDSVCNSG